MTFCLKNITPPGTTTSQLKFGIILRGRAREYTSSFPSDCDDKLLPNLFRHLKQTFSHAIPGL